VAEIQAAAGSYGLDAADRRDQARARAVSGARAALESFYFAFNHRSLEVLDGVLAPDDLVTVNNPLGGRSRGREAILALYRRIFSGAARVWVALQDIIEYAATDAVLFAGHERGELTRDGTTLPLSIRTSRLYQFMGPELGWRQTHHHGSIDDPTLLQRYRNAV
jgi:limonene-1,2-epoxide hydrolase